MRLVDDTDELRIRIQETEAQALAHAEQLAALILDGGEPIRAAALAITVQEQTKLARRLRHGLTVMVAG